MRILELPSSEPEKIGSKKVHKNKHSDKQRQLNLFNTGRILNLHPSSPFEKALMLDERGDKQAAEQLYHKAIKEGNNTADAYCNLGILEAQKSNKAEAINYLTLSLKYNPRHREAHFNIANLYTEAGNIDLGVLHYELAIMIDPTFTSSYFNLGLSLAADHQYHRAIKTFQQYQQVCKVYQKKAAMEMINKLKLMIDS